MSYLCSENKNYEAMKPKTKSNIILTLFLISAISFEVMIFGLFIWFTIWGVFAAVIGSVSFSIAFALGIPESKGLNSSWRDDGLG